MINYTYGYADNWVCLEWLYNNYTQVEYLSESN